MFTQRLLKLEMKKLRTLLRRKPLQSMNDSTNPLIEDDNDTNNGHNPGTDNPVSQNTLNTEAEQYLQGEANVTLQELVKLLSVSSDVIHGPSEDGSVQPEPNSEQHNTQQQAVFLIKKLVTQCFPRPPADLAQGLQQHLVHVQEAAFNKLLKLSPLLAPRGLMGCLIDCLHRETLSHLHSLLQSISSSKDSFVLMNWAKNTYLSQVALGLPDHRLYSEWEAKAEAKLLKNVQREVSEGLDNILRVERDQTCCFSEEGYVGFYVDTIQCISAMSKEAQKIGQELCNAVKNICFQELLVFVKRYTAGQSDVLRNKAELDNPQIVHFLKTLKTCKELRQHVQTQEKNIQTALLTETVETLENMEDFTLKLLREIIVNIAESHLKNYFKSDNTRFRLFAALQKYFPKLWFGLDEQKVVMDEAYKIIAHTYLKHLIQSSQCKLRRRWSPYIGHTVSTDAAQLHDTISELAPGVEQWNLVLVNIQEVLECNSLDGLKITLARIQDKCQSEDRELLPDLLRWKGLSKREVREVLEALPGSPLKPTSGSSFSSLICCCCCCSD